MTTKRKELYFNELRIGDYKKEFLFTSLLDNNLITATSLKKINMKIIKMGDYIQVYKYSNSIYRKDRRLESDKLDRKIETEIKINKLFKLDTNIISNKELKKIENNQVIEERNIIRSKLNLQRLVKANEREFNTFITLTFAENITDLTYTNKCFHNFCRQIQRIKKDFKYVCVPEFQKRGAVHYHLLTNLDIEKDNNIIILQEGKTNQYDVKYWNHGFSSVFTMKNINVVGYISKYMTKDIDNRFFSRRRYFYSQNLKKPEEITFDFSKDVDVLRFFEILNDYEKVYSNNYKDYFNNMIEFLEYKKNS